MGNPSFTIDFGPMYSGKTSELIRRCSKVTDAIASTLPQEGKVDEVIFITDRNQRDRNVASSSHGITTHTFNFIPSRFLKVREVEQLKEIQDKELEKVVLIGIDEGFYPDLEEMVLYWFLEKGISISIACIDGSFEQKNIVPQVYNLIPYATKVIKHSAYCSMCLQEGRQENAFYTIKMNTNGEGGLCEHKNKGVEYGGLDKYKPVCYRHLLEYRKRKLN